MNRLKSVSSSSYKKFFICDVLRKSLGDQVHYSGKWTKVALFGVIVAVKEYPERFIYTVDDGTGMLDCSIKKDSKMKKCADMRKGASSKPGKPALPAENSEQLELDVSWKYIRGDAMIAYGHTYMIKNIPRLEIMRHYKVKDPNDENVWMADQLMLYQEEY